MSGRLWLVVVGMIRVGWVWFGSHLHDLVMDDATLVMPTHYSASARCIFDETNVSVYEILI
jgi:hypothetical protein